MGKNYNVYHNVYYITWFLDEAILSMEEVQLFQLILKTKLYIYSFTISMNPIYDKFQPAFSR